MFELPFSTPTVTYRQVMQILIAVSVPLVMYRVTRMSMVLKWQDITVAMGLVTVPIVVILGLQGVLGGTSIVGVLSAIMLSSLGVIVTD